MAMLTVRNLPDEVHRALRMRAAEHGRSTEAEVRDILEAAVKPADRVKLGTFLVEYGDEAGLSDDEYSIFENIRDRTPATPVSFE